jgi:hypothetical protein
MGVGAAIAIGNQGEKGKMALLVIKVATKNNRAKELGRVDCIT